MKRFINLVRNNSSYPAASVWSYFFAVLGFGLLTSANFVAAQTAGQSPLLVNPSIDDFRKAMPTAPGTRFGQPADDNAAVNPGAAQPLANEEDEPCPAGLICRGPGPREMSAKSVNVVIPFGFDSAQLNVDALAILRSLATVLKEERMRFVKSVDVAGHSDGVGNAEYNKALSQRRAQAVRDALQKFELSRLPLRAYGFGMERLRNASNPKSPENRRVEFVIRY